MTGRVRRTAPLLVLTVIGLVLCGSLLHSPISEWLYGRGHTTEVPEDASVASTRTSIRSPKRLRQNGRRRCLSQWTPAHVPGTARDDGCKCATSGRRTLDPTSLDDHRMVGPDQRCRWLLGGRLRLVSRCHDDPDYRPRDAWLPDEPTGCHRVDSLSDARLRR